MYVNPEDDKVKQLHPDIGRTLPKEKLKLGQKMKSGSKVKNKKRPTQKAWTWEGQKKAIRKATEKKSEPSDSLSREELTKIRSKNWTWKAQQKAIRKATEKKKSGGQIKKYNYRRGGLTTLRKPKRG